MVVVEYFSLLKFREKRMNLFRYPSPSILQSHPLRYGNVSSNSRYAFVSRGDRSRSFFALISVFTKEETVQYREERVFT